MNGSPEGFELLSRTSLLVVLLEPFYAGAKAATFPEAACGEEAHKRTRLRVMAGVLLNVSRCGSRVRRRGFRRPSRSSDHG